MKQYLEYKDNKSSKFWQIEVKGNAHTVTYGKIGTDGQSKTKKFKSAQEAQKDAEKLVAQKKKKGYTGLAKSKKQKTASSKPPTKKNLSGKMSLYKETMEFLREFGIVGCHVRLSNIIAFSTQKFEVDDPLEPQPTMLFFYNPTRKKEDQWAFRGWRPTTGVHGSPCFKPNERWIFMSEHGDVYVLGQGDDNDEKPIIKSPRKYFTALKCIVGGYTYAVGSGRKVYKRTAPNTWKQLHTKAMASHKTSKADTIGFEDINGFSDTEIYACGGAGDLWKFNGKTWKSVKIPTKANLKNICCASDGKVYITTDSNLLLIGRDNQWKVTKQNISDHIMEEIVCYKDKVLVSSDEMIFQVKNEKLVEADLSIPAMDTYTHMAVGDGILVVSGIHSAYLYNGKKWSKIFSIKD